MSVSTCYHCYHNKLLSDLKNHPLSFKESYSQNKVRLLGEVFFCKLQAVKEVVKANKVMSVLTLGCAVTATAFAVGLVAWCVAGVAVSVLAPLVAASVPFLAAFSILGGVIEGGFFASYLPGMIMTMFLAQELETVYKKSHDLEANPERIRNRKICLVLEAKGGGSAFHDISNYKGIETKYPIAYRQIGHANDVISAIEDAQKTVKDIKIIVFRGHGSQTYMRLSENNILAVSTHINIFRRMHELLGPDAVIVLDSCKTAQVTPERSWNMANNLSFVCRGRQVWASKESYSSQMKIRNLKPLKIEALLPTVKNKKLFNFLNVAFRFIPSFITKRFTKDSFVVYRDGVLV